MAGLELTGFVPKTLQEIKAELEAAFKLAFGESIDVSPQSAFGQVIGVMSERFSDLWDQSLALHAAFNPDSASGASLENVAGITGTFRLAATKSRIQRVVCVGTAGTVLAAGRVASVLATLARFASVSAATIAAVPAHAFSTAYALGARVTKGGNVYEVITPGTSAGSGGPTGTGSDITDNTVHWKYLGAGTGAVETVFDAEETGPVIAVTGTLATIETPVSGWNAVVNAEDADPGRNTETDTELRIRREIELRATGKSALESIRAAILRVSGVTACTVFENVTDSTDVDGLPPHSVEVLVRDGLTGTTANTDVSEAVFENVAAGIATYGTVTATVTDSQGIDHTVKWSRPAEQNVWIILNAIKDPAAFPSDGSDQIKAKLVAYGASLATGKDVVASALAAQAFGVSGVLDVTSVLIGLSNPPTLSTTIAISLRQLAKLDTARITVNLSNGTP